MFSLLQKNNVCARFVHNRSNKSTYILTRLVSFLALSSLVLLCSVLLANLDEVYGVPYPSRNTMWRTYGQVALAFREASTFFYSAVGFCIFLNTQITPIYANAMCVGTIILSYLANLAANQARAGEQFAMAPPDWLYAPETYHMQLMEEGINIYGDDNPGGGHDPGELKRRASGDHPSITYDFRKIPRPITMMSAESTGSNFEWWHIGHYPNVRNGTSHFYGGGVPGERYSTLVFGGISDDMDPEASMNMKKRVDDGVHNLVFEYSSIDPDLLVTSQFAEDERARLYFSYDLAHQIAHEEGSTFDGCFNVYDSSGPIAWGYLHATLAHTLEGLQSQDRYEYFGQCYDSLQQDA